jgi:hypothetical protein
MNLEMQRRALAARDAHHALLALKKLVDSAAKTTHAAELSAIHMAIHPMETGDIKTALQDVRKLLDSSNFATSLSEAREKLEAASS